MIKDRPYDRAVEDAGGRQALDRDQNERAVQLGRVSINQASLLLDVRDAPDSCQIPHRRKMTRWAKSNPQRPTASAKQTIRGAALGFT